MKTIEKNYDFVVVGAGVSGICAAISAARHGVKTALVHDRPVLGGNASSEVRVSINGAGRNSGWRGFTESGVVLEMTLRNKKVNPQYSFNVFDNIMWEMVKEEENIDLFLNCSMQSADVKDNKITSITAYQSSTRNTYILSGKLFADNTGDGNLAFSAGAKFTIGHEARATYNEPLAPIEANSYTMGSSILYTAKDMGKPVKFIAPKWAYKIDKSKLKNRDVHEITNGYWWVEVGGDDLNIVDDAETIRDELLKYAYGVFDYVKNSGDFPEAENYALDWICSTPGKRESRRIYGDYVLTQNDIDDAKIFEDAVAYGGWTMDDHTVGGIRAMGTSADDEGTIWHDVKELYTIPHRCLYSVNIENLYVGGRCISASHMALSSTRVIGTCAVIGQALGTSAVIATKYGILPREVNNHIKELQQMLIKDDAYLPQIKANDKEDIISNYPCKITASSNVKGGEPQNINSDFSRKIGDDENAWVSEKMSKDGEWVKVDFDKEREINEVLLRFDPNFSKYISIRITESCRNNEEMQAELVRDYKIEYIKNGEVVKETIVEDNFLRVNKHAEKVSCDAVKITVLKTYGHEFARICDLRIY